MEEELKTSEENYRNLFMNSQAGIFKTDIETGLVVVSLLKESDEVMNYEEKFKSKDCSVFWIRYSARLMPDKGRIEGVNEDITDFKRFENERFF